MKKASKVVIFVLGMVCLLTAHSGYLALAASQKNMFDKCAPAKTVFKSPTKVSSFDKISLERGNSEFLRDAYKLSITGDGKVNFETADDHPRTEAAQLSPEKIKLLVDAINNSAYLSIPAQGYFIEECVFGSAGWFSSVVVNGTKHSVRRFCCAAPQQLMDFEKTVEQVVDIKKWTKQAYHPY